MSDLNNALVITWPCMSIRQVKDQYCALIYTYLYIYIIQKILTYIILYIHVCVYVCVYNDIGPYFLYNIYIYQ